MEIIKQPRRKIAVIGGGVVGLTTALILSREHDVTIIAEQIGIKSDSRNASAIWHVYLVPETKEILVWAQITLEKLCDLAANEPLAGVELVPGVELFRKSGPAPHLPSWSHIPKMFRMLTEEEVASYNNFTYSDITKEELSILIDHPVIWGYYIDAPVANMQRYLLWIEQCVRDQNVQIQQKRISSFDELTDTYEIIVNCSGFGARELAKDKDFVPYKGQYFILKGSDKSPKTYVGDDYHPKGITYLIPIFDEVMVGGWAEKDCEDLIFTLKWEETIRKAGLYFPWIRTCSTSDQARPPVVGIRPARSSGVRLELDNSFRTPIIHNYGHGGSGFSLSWGCAEAVNDIVANL